MRPTFTWWDSLFMWEGDYAFICSPELLNNHFKWTQIHKIKFYKIRIQILIHPWRILFLVSLVSQECFLKKKKIWRMYNTENLKFSASKYALIRNLNLWWWFLWLIFFFKIIYNSFDCLIHVYIRPRDIHVWKGKNHKNATSILRVGWFQWLWDFLPRRDKEFHGPTLFWDAYFYLKDWVFWYLSALGLFNF